MKTALEQAVAWFARLQAPDCRPEQRTEFIRWLAEHEDHTRAYAEVERLVRSLDERAARDPELRAMAEAALVKPAAGTRSFMPARIFNAWKQHLVPLAVAAGLVVSLFLVTVLRDFSEGPRASVAFNTPPRELRVLTLDDGTLASLDSDSALTVQMDSRARAVNLVQGRALFDVAHDKQRPFSVSAGNARVVALGTRFQVQNEGQVVIVTLEEGSVDVVRELDGRTVRTQLRPGEQLRFEQDSRSWETTTIETDTATSWSRGRHAFRNTRLGDAVEEVNRYAQTQVRLDDPALADLTVSGNFVIGDSALILSAFAAALPVRVVDGGNELVLYPAYNQGTE